MLAAFKRLKASLGDGGSPISLHLQGFCEFVVYREKHRERERERERYIERERARHHL